MGELGACWRDISQGILQVFASNLGGLKGVGVIRVV